MISTLLDVNFLYPLFPGESLNLTNNQNQDSIVSPSDLIEGLMIWYATVIVIL